MKAMNLLNKTEEALRKALDGIVDLQSQARTKATVNRPLLYDTLGHLSAANCALQSFECLVRTGEQPKSGE